MRSLAVLLVLSGCAKEEAEPEQAPALEQGALNIARVTLNQAASVSLADKGTVVDSPVVAARPGWLRVYLEQEAGWQAQEVRVEFTLDGDKHTQSGTFDTDGTVVAEASTFNFDLASADIQRSQNLRDQFYALLHTPGHGQIQ